jgi:hypothetical protein
MDLEEWYVAMNTEELALVAFLSAVPVLFRIIRKTNNENTKMICVVKM